MITNPHTVRPGDTLWDIATEFYGEGRLYRLIVDANPFIRDPDLIFPGQILQLPDRDPHPSEPEPEPQRFAFRVLRPLDLVDLQCVAVGFRLTAFGDTGRPVTHTVVAGDTLSAIANRYYGDAERFPEIARANHIPNPDLIFPGQVFLIPGPAAPAPPPEPLVYKVVRGDTLWEIAKRHLGDPLRFQEIADANHIPNPNLIFPGQEFVIPPVGGPAPMGPESPNHLVSDDDNAYLAVSFGSQNLFEQRFEATALADTEPVNRHAAILAAGDSRVVFAAPIGTRIEFSIAGVLRAMATMGLKVSASATARIVSGEAAPADVPNVPVAPSEQQTAIEAPFRLIVSPSARGAFVNDATGAVAAGESPRISLWSARFAVREETDGVLTRVDESYDATQRIVRALHVRDDDGLADPGFRGSLDSRERHSVVRQSAERGVTSTPSGEPIEPEPITVRRLQLSAIGATLDWSAHWDDTRYPAEPPDSPHPLLSSYRHLAPLGRDAYVEVQKPGYIYPFGHRAALVEVTERQLPTGAAPVACLVARRYIVVREHTRQYIHSGARFEEARMPFTAVSIDPQVTPNLVEAPAGTAFVPAVDAAGRPPFFWTLNGVDHVGKTTSTQAPLVFVPDGLPVTAAALSAIWAASGSSAALPGPARWIGVGGAEIALAPSAVRGDTTVRVEDLHFDAKITDGGRSCEPRMEAAHVNVPALVALNGGTRPSIVAYPDFGPGGFGSGHAQVFAALTEVRTLDFSTGSDRAGGFVQPSVGVRALSRTLGAIGDSDTTAGSALDNGTFDPVAFMGEVTPKLFGIFKFTDILAASPLARAPKLISDSLGVIDRLQAEFQRLLSALNTLSADLAVDAPNAAHGAAAAALGSLAAQVTSVRGSLGGAADPVIEVFREVLAGRTPDAAGTAQGLMFQLRQLDPIIANPVLPAYARAALQKPYGALTEMVNTAQDAAQLVTALRAAEPPKVLRFEWQPEVLPWPKGPGPLDEKVFVPAPEGGLTISVEVRATDGHEPVTDVSAQLRAFELALLPGEPLMELRFSRIGFRVGTGRKPEIDVVFDKLVFVGVLEFIEKLQQVVPFDGFADPPYVDISPAGATAGFDLAIPSVAVGMFSMENIALHAECRVPFIADAVTVGFGFCCKESPFRLTVSAVAGGGWVAIRLCPEGLVGLEMGLEAGANVSVDLGVASGSVSVMIGVYLRLEGDKGQLTGYFRIRGEVEVLEIASASITLELSLTYDFDTGKLIGRASLQVEVEVLFFSASVEITVERRLAGSKGDPKLIQIMPPESGGQDMWNSYFDSFVVGA